MKTVKEFKDAGLVFVNNDIIGCVTSDTDSGGITIGDATGNGELPIHNAWNVREFAWRENTGEKSAFIGAVECVSEFNHKGETNMTKLVWNPNIKKWRPSLVEPLEILPETPEEKEALDKIFGADSAPVGCPVRSDAETAKQMLDGLDKLKPVYTQAMADNGERAPAGSVVMVGDTHYELIKYVVRGNIKFPLCVEVVGMSSYMFNADELKPIYTRTSKEKAIDNLMFYGDQTQTKKKAAQTLQAIIDGKIEGVTFKGEE